MSEKKMIQTFQEQVSNLLLRHRSFLDVVSKLQEASARINRALMKAVTECGCIQVIAKKQPFPTDQLIHNWKNQLQTHLSGTLCDHCCEIVKVEMGKNLFYLSALCNLLEIRLEDVFQKELDHLHTLGVFNFR